jgi:hypothetical protein
MRVVESPEDKRPIGGPRRRWDNAIKTDLRKILFWLLGLDSSGSG